MVMQVKNTLYSQCAPELDLGAQRLEEMVLVLCLGTADVHAQDTASPAGSGSANNTPAIPVAKTGKKRELTAEQKAFKESIKAIRARMTVDGEVATRNREKARRDAEKAGRTLITLSGASDGNGVSEGKAWPEKFDIQELAIRASSTNMDNDFIKAAREREKALREAKNERGGFYEVLRRVRTSSWERRNSEIGSYIC
jgi:hypothetical protein